MTGEERGVIGACQVVSLGFYHMAHRTMTSRHYVPDIATQLWCQYKGKQKPDAIALSFGRYAEVVKLLLGRGVLLTLLFGGSLAYLKVLDVLD